jgi:type IV pilus assembly protein PilZ
MGGKPKRQPLAKIVTRKEFHCPSCRALIGEHEFTSKVINCPSCGVRVSMPGVQPATVKAPNERREKRCPVAMKVKYKNARQFKVDYTKNVSRGGMFIKTTTPIEPGTKLELELFLPDLNEPIRLSVEVMHSHSPEVDAQNAGVGVRFLDIDPLSRSILVNYLSAVSDCD